MEKTKRAKASEEEKEELSLTDRANGTGFRWLRWFGTGDWTGD